MRRRSSLWIAALGLALTVAGGEALAGKGGGKPGGGGDPGNTTPLDILHGIVDTHDSRGGVVTLYGMQDDGSGSVALATARGGYGWSPDGTQVAFYGLGAGTGFEEYGIYLMDVPDGTPGLLIPIDSPTAGQLDWCPVPAADGTERLAFTMADDVWVATFDDTGLLDMEVVGPDKGSRASPTWSPDGERIAVKYGSRIEVLDLADRDESGLPATYAVYQSTQFVPLWPAWSKTTATGNRIAFVAYDAEATTSPNCLDLYVLTVTQDAGTGAWSGSTPQNLTETPDDEENGSLTWSPDDSTILLGVTHYTVTKAGKLRGTGLGLQEVDSWTGARTQLADAGNHPSWKRFFD